MPGVSDEKDGKDGVKIHLEERVGRRMKTERKDTELERKVPLRVSFFS